MPRFFASPENIGDENIIIEGEDARHIARALRLAVGDEIDVSGGVGTDYLCRLTKIRDEECVAEILNSYPSKTEPPLEITLYMAYPKGDKLETVVQKAVELGASVIIPFESQRCIKRPAQDRAEKIGARLQRIASEAAKQCGRGRLPSVLGAVSFDGLVSRMGGESPVLFCYEGEGTQPIKAVLDGMEVPKSLGVIVGSEGGFSREEADRLIAAGAIPVGLGPRILRCETAPAYALSAISYKFEL